MILTYPLKQFRNPPFMQLPVTSIKTNINPKSGKPVSTTVTANVSYAPGSCDAPGSMYQTANLLITTQIASGDTTFKLMTSGIQG